MVNDGVERVGRAVVRDAEAHRKADEHEPADEPAALPLEDPGVVLRIGMRFSPNWWMVTGTA
jgi:hypothetical protein